jgi:neopullulanase
MLLLHTISKSCLVILLFICISFTINNNALAQTSITKIEPPNWWVGMANDTVQLMVYGSNLQNAKVTCSNKDAKIVNVFAKDNDYAFVDVVIAKNAKPQDIELFFTTTNNNKIPIYYPILKNDNYKPKGFSQQDMVYLIMPDRFCNGDTANDFVPNMEQTNRAKIDGRHGGDLQGIINQMDYIKELGVTSIWLTPFQEMNDKKGSYHGYGSSNFYEADARYTSGKRGAISNNEQYKKMVDAAHQKGLKVIMDIVLNHIGEGHSWQSHVPRIANWVHDSAICNFQMPTLTDPYATASDKISMEKGWFVPSMPDLNQDNPRMATYLIQNNIWWIKSADIDALRLDTAPFSEKHFLTKWANAIRKEFPSISIVGEVWSIINQPNSTKYFQSSTTNKDKYSSQIPSVMDLPLWEAMIQGLQQNDATKPYYCLAQDYIYDAPQNNFILLGNHDMERYYTAIGQNFNKYKLGLIWLATMRGIPQTYYGDELCMTGNKGINDGYMRQDIPGFGDADALNIFTKKGYTNADTAMQALVFNRNLWNWRKTNEIIANGKLIHYYPKNGVYVYKRFIGKKAVIVLLNFKNESVTIDWNAYAEIINKEAKINVLFSADTILQTIDIKQKTVLPAYGFLVMEIK